MFQMFQKIAYSIIATVMAPSAASVTVFNKLENTSYCTDADKCVILTGTVGEQWVTGLKKLCSTYTAEDGSPLTPEVISALLAGKEQVTMTVRTKADGPVIWARRIDGPMDVATSWGDVLHANAPGVPHGEGDYLVAADKDGAPDPNDQWVVNGAIFPATYKEVAK